LSQLEAWLYRSTAGIIHRVGIEAVARPADRQPAVALARRDVLLYLDTSGRKAGAEMATIKISSKIEESVWEDLKNLAAENHRNISGVLTEAIADYVRRHRVRPEVLSHLEDSIRDNEELGRLLAR
jgi:predicted transcriptional regulator